MIKDQEKSMCNSNEAIKTTDLKRHQAKYKHEK